MVVSPGTKEEELRKEGRLRGGTKKEMRKGESEEKEREAKLNFLRGLTDSLFKHSSC